MTGATSRALRAASVALVASLLSFLVVEGAVAFLRPSIYENVEPLGWRLRSRVRRVFSQSTLGGKEYEVAFSTNVHGVRTFGMNDHAPVRILVLGDSFTAEPFASDDRMWYSKMAERLSVLAERPLDDFYVIAGGAGGYGTYQQVLLSEALVDKVDPTVFILQFCVNDFVNNHLEWESESLVRNQYLRRPFVSIRSDAPRHQSGVLARLYRSGLEHRTV